VRSVADPVAFKKLLLFIHLPLGRRQVGGVEALF
jgi:hypothetical protein